MIVRDDMRAWFVPELVELLGEREFLQTRGGTRVLEQVSSFPHLLSVLYIRTEG